MAVVARETADTMVPVVPGVPPSAGHSPRELGAVVERSDGVERGAVEEVGRDPSLSLPGDVLPKSVFQSIMSVLDFPTLPSHLPYSSCPYTI